MEDLFLISQIKLRSCNQEDKEMYIYQNVEELIQEYLKGYVDVSGVFRAIWYIGQEDAEGFGDPDRPLPWVCKSYDFEVLGDLNDQGNTLIVKDSIGYGIVTEWWGPFLLRLTDELIDKYNNEVVTVESEEDDNEIQNRFGLP